MRRPRPTHPAPARRGARRSLVAAALALLLVPLWAVPARAAVACTYSGATKILQITLGDDDYVYLGRNANNIEVQSLTGGTVVVSCSGGTPTVDNTNQIELTGSAGTNTLAIDLSQGYFAPGATGELGNSDEIEITVDLLGGSNQMFISFAPANLGTNIRAGTAGINLNAAEATGKDADLSIVSETTLQIGGQPFAVNKISGAGGAGTGGPYPEELDIRGYYGNDILIGGSNNDNIDGHVGRDLMAGGGGGDVIDGDRGRDTVTYAGTNGATVDLSAGSAPDDGTGSEDFLFELESILGSARADDLSGDEGSNKISGGGGRDLITGNDANDRLFGNGGRDRLKGNFGDDKLDGGSRRDLCRGGPGRDTLRSCEL